MKYALLLFLVPAYCFSQPLTLQKVIGTSGGSENIFCIERTADNGYIVCGNTYNSTNKGYLAKLDSNLVLQWSKMYYKNTSTNGELFESVKQCSDGGYIAAGRTFCMGPGTPSYANIFVVRTDPYGDTLWTKVMGDSYDDYAESVLQDPNGDFILTGLSAVGPTTYRSFFIRLNANGGLVTARRYNSGVSDYMYSLRRTNDGNFIMCGEAESPTRVCLIKTDLNGDTLWTRSYGVNGNEYGWEFRQTADNGFIICGDITSFGPGSNDLYIIKTDSSGNLQWSKVYGGANSEWGFGLDADTSGYIFCGMTNSFGFGNTDMFAIRTDLLGDTIWTQCYGNQFTNAGYYVSNTPDGGYIIGGSYNSFSPASGYIVKTDSMGYSGCNQKNANFTLMYPNTVARHPSLQVINYVPFVLGSTCTITPNSNSYDLCPTAEENGNDTPAQVSIFPNPFSVSSTLIFQNWVKAKNAVFRMFDELGREVKQINCNEAGQDNLNLQIDRGQLPAGLYFFSITCNGMVLASGKVIVD
jgi:hypothetical protein